MSKADSQIISSGVDELIARLQQDGIDAGKRQADELVVAARAEAARILSQARMEADAERQQALADIEREQRAARESLQIAFRDLVLDMKAMMAKRFATDVGRLVRAEVERPPILEKLVLAAAARKLEQAGLPDQAELEILLPATPPGLDDIRRAPESARSGAVADLAFALQEDMLREGVSFAPRDDSKAGIHLILRNDQIEVDLSDRAIADLLLDYLQPRFRAILDGIIR